MLNTKQQAARLTIYRVASEYHFRLTLPSDKIYPMDTVWQIPVNAAVVDSIKGRIIRAVAEANRYQVTSETTSPFVSACKGLYDEFLPKDSRFDKLREALKNLSMPLLLSIDDPEVFWELIYDGEAFFGLKHEIGRQLMSRDVPVAVPRNRETWRCLMIADPNEDEPDWALPETAAEAVRLRDWLLEANVQNIDYLQGSDASFRTVLDYLLDYEYDIIHYAGHIVLSEADHEYALRLHGGGLLSASVIKKHFKGSPIVFLNGCWSGKFEVSDASQRVVGLTDAFLSVGAQVVVGALFAIPDEGARVFAERFYTSVLKNETVGKAMREARNHVKDRPECGAAWASFVMYGDPCLRLEFREDVLQKLLGEVDLSRHDFENSALRVIEQALEYGRSRGGLSTIHFFTALISGDDSTLRDTLKELGIPAEALQEVLQEAFEQNVADTDIDQQARLSNSIRKMLTHARQVARDLKKEKISEPEMIEGFVKIRGGQTGKLLDKIGVSVEALSSLGGISIEDPPGHSDLSVGPLTEHMCSGATWHIVLYSAYLAHKTSNGYISTIHLFASMLQADNSHLAKSLRRFGITPAHFSLPPEFARSRIDIAALDRIIDTECSPSVKEILSLARTIAAEEDHPKVSVQDLLHGFVAQGGGNSGKMLLKLGLPPELLVSSLFDETGTVDQARFDDASRKVLETMLRCATEKGHRAAGRIHLLYGFLQQNDVFREKLAQQQQDADKLADLLLIALPAKPGRNHPIPLDLPHLSAGLARVLCLAETAMLRTNAERIDASHLVDAFLRDGGGSAGQFLVKQGVRWGKL